MSPFPEHAAAGAAPPALPRSGWLAAGLVLAVVAALAGLNLLGPRAVSISAEQLDALVDEGLISEARVRGSAVECALSRPVRLRGERQLVSLVVCELAADGPPDADRWRQAGARVLHLPPDERRDWPWALLVSALLAGGIWHLVVQARHHRRVGSPRQRLLEADRQLAEGCITPEQHGDLVAELTARM